MALGIYSSVAFDLAGGVAVAANASIEVRREDTGALASIFSGRSGSASEALSNPFTADSEGRFEFYAAGIDQGYQITITKGSVSTVRNNQPVGLLREYDPESVEHPEQSSTPPSPSAGARKLYFKDDGVLYQLDSSGRETPVDVAGPKNKIINGNFDLWQRGISFTASNVYTADRWKQNHNTGGATYSRQEFTLGQTDVPGEPEFFLREVVTSAAASTSSVLRQRIEGVRTLAGQTATLSFWAKVDTAKSFTIDVNQVFGTGGSPAPSSTVQALSTSQAIGTSWARYTFTFNVPSIAGKILGSNDDDYLEFHILETAGFSTYTLDIAQVQLEAGSVATDFEKRPLGEELSLAERYGISCGYNLAGEAVSATNAVFFIDLGEKMRATPSATLKDSSPIINEFGVGDQTGHAGSIVSSVLGPRGGYVEINGFSGLTAGNLVQMKQEDVIFLDAEL